VHIRAVKAGSEGKYRRRGLVYSFLAIRFRWVDNIKMDLREIGWAVKDWIELARDRDQWRALVNTVMNLRVP
jgi:hypothetical protein